MAYSKFIVFALFIFVRTEMSGQLPYFVWAKSQGSTNNEMGADITTDKSGNVYTIGRFFQTVDFDPGPSTFTLLSSGAEDAFLQKLSPNGTFLWAVSFGSGSPDYGNCVKTDDNNNVYISGHFRGTVDFDPGLGIYNLTSAGLSNDVFVVKLNSSGNLLWAKRFGDVNSDIAIDLAIDKSGNIINTGYYEGNVDFDPGPGAYIIGSVGNQDIYIQKLDSMGNFKWAGGIGGVNYDAGYSVTTDKFKNVYVTGSFALSADFNPGIGTFNMSASIQDVFIEKLDSNGVFIWAKKLGGSGTDYGFSICLDGSSNIYTTGYYNGVGDFDPGPGTSNLVATGNYDTFISKLDSSGNFSWVKNIGGTLDDIAYTITLDKVGNIYSSGRFSGTCDFDPGIGVNNITAVGSDDGFVCKLDASGNFLWARNIGSTSLDNVQCIHIDSLYNIYGTGYFMYTADFNPNLPLYNMVSTSNSWDIFTFKWDQCSSSNSITATACNTYTLNSQTYTLSGSYSQLLTNSKGCDSTIYLNLTITTVNNNVLQAGVVLTASISGLVYQWLDCTNSYAAIPSATAQSFTASVNGNYAVSIINSGCTDTSACYIVNSVGIIETSSINQQCIYPNPSSGKVFIEIPCCGKSDIEIYDSQGRLIQTKSDIEEKIIELDLENATGLYFIRVKNINANTTYRLLKN